MLWNIDPWRELERMRRDIDSLFSGTNAAGITYSFPLINVYDGREELTVVAELPGLAKESVTITFVDNTLTIAGKKQPLEAAKNMAVIRQERSEGDFSKSLRIPVKVNQEKISAAFKDGILTVALPKAEEAKPKTISIAVK